MTLSNIQLDLVHFIRLRVDLIPTIETFVVEVLPYFRFVVHGGEEDGIGIWDGAGWNG